MMWLKHAKKLWLKKRDMDKKKRMDECEQVKIKNPMKELFPFSYPYKSIFPFEGVYQQTQSGPGISMSPEKSSFVTNQVP